MWCSSSYSGGSRKATTQNLWLVSKEIVCTRKKHGGCGGSQNCNCHCRLSCGSISIDSSHRIIMPRFLLDKGTKGLEAKMVKLYNTMDHHRILSSLSFPPSPLARNSTSSPWIWRWNWQNYYSWWRRSPTRYEQQLQKEEQQQKNLQGIENAGSTLNVHN